MTRRCLVVAAIALIASCQRPEPQPGPPAAVRPPPLYKLSPVGTAMIGNIGQWGADLARDRPLRGNGVYQGLLAGYKPMTGDVILRMCDSAESLGIAISSLSGYSHCGILLVEAKADGGEQKLYVLDVHPDNVRRGNGSALARTPLHVWLADSGETRVLHALALRLKGDRPRADQIQAILRRCQIPNSKADRNIVFDYDFLMANGDTKLYCSEFVYVVLCPVHPAVRKVMNYSAFVAKIAKDCETKYKKLPSEARAKLSWIVNLRLKRGKRYTGSPSRRLITPGSFEWSPDFAIASYGQRADIGNLKKLLDLYNHTKAKLLVLVSLHGKWKTTSLAQIRSDFQEAGLSKTDLGEVMCFLAKERQGRHAHTKRYNSYGLVKKMLNIYANSEHTYDLIFSALPPLRPAQGDQR